MEGAKWMDIRNDQQKGISYTEISRKYHKDPRTAKRYAESPQRPEYTLTAPKPSKLDPYKEQITQWLEEAPYSAQRILEKIKEQGYPGSYSIVKHYVRGKKDSWTRKRRYGLKQCLAFKVRWTGPFLRIIWYWNLDIGRSCTVF